MAGRAAIHSRATGRTCLSDDPQRVMPERGDLAYLLSDSRPLLFLARVSCFSPASQKDLVMPYGSALPLTGGAGVLLMGHVLGLDDIIATAIIGVLFAIGAFRYGSRIGRARKTIFTLAGAAVFGVAFLAHFSGLGWPMSTSVGLVAAIATLCLSARLVPQERRAVA
jgi:hypothetical protein